MAAPKIRADYDRLMQCASGFGQHADLIRQALQQLTRQAGTLQGGDWAGQGAQAFYTEMDSQVLPTLNRLIRALEAAATTTRQIRQIAEQMEAEAAACFMVPGAPSVAAPDSPPGLGANVSAFVGGRADANGGGGGGSGSGGGAKAAYVPPTTNAWTDTDRVMMPLLEANPRLAEQVFKNPALLKRLIALSRSGYALVDGPDSRAGANTATGIITVGPKTSLPDLSRFARQAHEQPRILRELDPALVAELKKDKVLFQRLRQLDEADWHTQIKVGTTADLTTYGRTDRTITIAPNNQIDSIRRGVAQAERAGHDGTPPARNMRPETYVRLNVDEELRRDAAQILHTLRAERAAVGSMSSRLPNMQPTAHLAAYHKIVKDFSTGKLKEWEAVRNMVDLMRTEPRGVTSAAKTETYYAERWNAFVDSLQGTPVPPRTTPP